MLRAARGAIPPFETCLEAPEQQVAPDRDSRSCRRSAGTARPPTRGSLELRVDRRIRSMCKPKRRLPGDQAPSAKCPDLPAQRTVATAQQPQSNEKPSRATPCNSEFNIRPLKRSFPVPGSRWRTASRPVTRDGLLNRQPAPKAQKPHTPVTVGLEELTGWSLPAQARLKRFDLQAGRDRPGDPPEFKTTMPCQRRFPCPAGTAGNGRQRRERPPQMALDARDPSADHLVNKGLPLGDGNRAVRGGNFQRIDSTKDQD